MAKLLKAIVDEEQPGLVICGKQAIDNDMNANRPDAGGADGLERRRPSPPSSTIDGDGSAVVTPRGRWRVADVIKVEDA